MVRSRWIVAGVVGVLALTGCAADFGTPSPTPTAACPEPVHGSAPDSCAPFDPDAAMAENERYRDRQPLSESQLADAAEPLAAATTALEPFALPGATVTESAVIDALVDAGFTRNSIQTLVAERADGTSVALGISADFGGCLFGGVSVRGLELDAGGYILDGGCLAMVGH
jgi:hypothetical protein